MMWSSTLALLLGVALVCEASAGRDAAADCHQVTRLALKLRDVYKASNEMSYWYDHQVQAGMIYFGVDFNDDEQVEKLFCMFIESEHKTIRELAKGSWAQFRMMDETRLSFFFSTVRNYMKSAAIQDENMISYYAKKVEFYDKTGFPSTFPSKLNMKELIKLLSGFDEDTLDIYHWLSEYDENYNLIFPIERFATVYSESNSLEEFIRTWMETEPYYSTDTDVEMRFNATLKQEEDDRESYNFNKDMYSAIIPLTKALESSGFLSVTRGGLPLDTCNFIGDTAVEAFGYVVELFGRETVQTSMTHMSLDLQVGDESALRKFVCSIMSGRTRKDLEKAIPRQWMEINNGFDSFYLQVSLNAMMLLVNPHEHLMLGMMYVRVVKAAERVGFPNFPLSITKAQAQELVNFMEIPFYMSGDNSDLVKTLLDADSLEEAADDHYQLNRLNDAMDILGGKTDIALKLVSCAYQLVMSAEELGLFMLP